MICLNSTLSNVRASKVLSHTFRIKIKIRNRFAALENRLRSGNACYYSVQKLLFSRLLSKNLKIKIYRNIILPVVLYGCET